MHIYFIGVLISTLIMTITLLTKFRKIRGTNKIFIVQWGDIFFAAICISASWITALIFVLMCIKPDIEHKIVRKF